MTAACGPITAIDAVYYNKIQEVPEGAEREASVERLREEYRADIDIHKLAAELAIDAIVPTDRLRAEIVARFARCEQKVEARPPKKHLVPPV